MKLWPFKKKEKLKITRLSDVQIKDTLKQFKMGRCPDIHLETRACFCIDCPKRGTCTIERTFALSGQCNNNFVTSCSLKKFLKGEFSDVKEETDTKRARITDSKGTFNNGSFFGYSEM